MNPSASKFQTNLLSSTSSAIAGMFDKLQASFLKPILPAFFFFAGVAYDSLTLTRIDRLLDNLILLLYLAILGVLVILTGRFQIGLIPPTPDRFSWTPLSMIHRMHPHFGKGLQFLLGGLFSAYAIFYSQSTSLSTTAIFLGVIGMFLIGNEFLQTKYSNLQLLVGLFAFVCSSFFTFFIPVLTGWMNSTTFTAGIVITGAIVWKIVSLTFRGLPDMSFRTLFHTSWPAYVLLVFCTGLYFLNWIPPIPLSLKFGGIYHHVEKRDDDYLLTFEQGQWYELWKQSDDRLDVNNPVYCFSSVFAPVTLHTTIYHHWQRRPFDTTQPFSTTDRIPIHITGGRERGYRAYTTKHRIQQGEWQVNVETEDGRLLGRMAFTAHNATSDEPTLTTISR